MSTWLPAHQALLTHAKTLRAVSLLGGDRYALIGHLFALWWWALDNAAVDGSLGSCSSREVALAAGWPLELADAFVSALINAGGPGRAGFLEVDDEGQLRLHDWESYGGKVTLYRADNATRMRKIRANQGVPAKRQPTPPDKRRNIFVYYEEAFGHGWSSTERESMLELEQTFEDEWIKQAFREAAEQNKRSLSYVKGILKGYNERGGPYDNRTNGRADGAGSAAGLPGYEPPVFIFDPADGVADATGVESAF